MTIYSSNPANNGAAGARDARLGRGSKDGVGSGDNDQPYTFGRRPRATAPFPFQTAQYARLLALRGRIHDGLYATDDLATSGVLLQFAQVADDADEADEDEPAAA